MKRILIIFFQICIIVILLTSLCAMASEKKWKDTWPKEIRIGSGSLGGVSYMIGSAVANSIKEEFPDVNITVEETKASFHNITLVNAKEVEIGTTCTDATWEAWYGGSAFEGQKLRNFGAILLSMPAPLMFVTLRGSGINSLADYNNQRYGAIGKGGSVAIFLDKVFKALDINVTSVYLNIGDSVQALKNGFIKGLTLAHPATAIQELALVGDVKWLQITKEEGEKILQSHPEYSYPLIVPAGYYKGQDEDLILAGLYNSIIVRDDLPEDLVYSIVEALFKHIDVIKATCPLMAQGMLPLENVKLLTTPLHPGALKYYKEAGIEIPEKLIFK